jgi:hypothetical protein
MMQNKCLAVATHQWCHHVDELKAEQAEQARKEHVMQTVVKRMMNGIMACAFGRWRENVSDNKMMLAKSSKVVMRCKNQIQLRRFDIWKELVRGIAHAQHSKNKCWNRKLTRVLASCNGVVACIYTEWNHIAALEKLSRAKTVAKTLKIVHRFTNRWRDMVFDAWRNQISKLQQLRGKASKLVCRCLNRILVLAYDHWYLSLAEEQELRALQQTQNKQRILEERLEQQVQARAEQLVVIKTENARLQHASQVLSEEHLALRTQAEDEKYLLQHERDLLQHQLQVRYICSCR